MCDKTDIMVAGKNFFVDEAHVRADADLRGLWVRKGEPALVSSTSPRLSDKVAYYSCCASPRPWSLEYSS